MDRQNTQIFIFLSPANEVCEGYVFTGVCHSVHTGGGWHAWLLGGACVVALGGGMRGSSWGGHAWLLLGGMHGCSGGVCMVAPGGVCGCSGGHVWLLPGGVCVVALGGHAWLLPGGQEVCGFSWGGMHGCSGGGMCGCSRGGGACVGYNEILRYDQ